MPELRLQLCAEINRTCNGSVALAFTRREVALGERVAASNPDKPPGAKGYAGSAQRRRPGRLCRGTLGGDCGAHYFPGVPV